MARWVVFGERIIGHVEAGNKLQAQLLAEEQHGPEWRRVQSQAEYEIALDEQAARQRRAGRRWTP